MLALALALAQATTPVEPDVVVIARRLRRMRLVVRFDDAGKVACRVKRSSGDPATDALACQATLDCAGRPAISKAEAKTCVRDRLVERLGIAPDLIHY